ncbi:MAG TPA: TauD/TfdA family dioxygenase [Pyrinomonadaceae bacterium]|jgi:alpha-ketoglutarate-dependent taurine dioxygenase
MMEESLSNWTFEPLAPFGGVIHSKTKGADLSIIPVPALKNLINEHRLLILRGFAPLSGNALPEFCLNLGEILEWEFGAVNELSVKDNARNYLYTNRAVPFHWDGAFAGKIPRYIFFHCDAAPAPEKGGETLFCDTVRLLELAEPEQSEKWEKITITYTTEKIVHYGGSFSSPMIALHPISREKTLRYAEPVTDLNPVQLEIKGIPEAAHQEFLQDMHRRLRDESVCYCHCWLDGDIVIADNFALLHGRRAFEPNTERRIRRVNIL